ncbi:FAD-dependent monooxygenase [Streptomyces hainanensis]|uniref:FAD-dependent monooxygenase n=1 Tax=Streptomyces hainanensis TaxID=402648 RepID=UPI0014050015
MSGRAGRAGGRRRAGERATDTQVVVVGAGPVGLLLAGELRLGGADVVVVERLAEPTTESRASTVHARTMELLDQRGLLPRLGAQDRETRGHFGGLPLQLDDLPSPFAGLWKIPQARIEALLADWAVGLGARVRRRHELIGLEPGPTGVTARLAGPEGTSTLRADYLVGCDGERSTVRELAGIPFPGAAAGREMLRADVAGVDVRGRRFERLAAGLAVAARRPDGVTRVMVHRFGAPPVERSREPAFAEVADVWAEVTGESIGHGTPLWVNAFDDTSRQAARYRAGRVLLAGDAAHAQLPVGGQALNLGLQDAANLGWKLAATVAGHAPDGLLDSYHRERHPVGARTMTNIRAQAQVLLGAHDVDPLREVLAELLAFAPVRRHLAAMIAGLDIRYDIGGGDHPLLGRRLPPTRLTTGHGATGTSALLAAGRGVLLDLAPPGAVPRVAVAAPWADRAVTAAARAERGGPLDGLTGLLLRPDGHVVWVGGSGGGGGDLDSALCRWFGEPRPRSRRSAA